MRRVATHCLSARRMFMLAAMAIHARVGDMHAQ
jgi:hypothetical protein